MDKIDGSFTIDVNGKPVTSIQGTDTESFTPASVGGEPAVFTLTDGRLVSGDWYLGRYLVEAKSLAPKPVMWFKKEDTSPDAIYPCQASQSGGSCELLLDRM
ncbi:hypothetical protein FQN49_002781 [Arthroderma sp. PD_2]|nr:hypothetical protein FQN49_002781 [Arthroderma sp. PD_2]